MPPSTTTTLSGAIGTGDVVINTAANASILPGYNIAIANESARVLTSDPSGLTVYRGNRGTAAAAANAGATVTYGAPSAWAASVGPAGPGVQSAPGPFDVEAAAEIDAEEAEKRAEKIEKKAKELEKKAADEAAAQAKAAEKAAADAKAAEAKTAASHR